MTKELQKKTPLWQKRRADLLEQACSEIADAQGRKETLAESVRRTARRYRGRSLGSGKKLKLSTPSLYRHWYAWKEESSSAAFTLHYKSLRAAKIDTQLIGSMLEVAFESGLNVAGLYEFFGGKKEEMTDDERRRKEELRGRKMPTMANGIFSHLLPIISPLLVLRKAKNLHFTFKKKLFQQQ